MQRFLIQIPHEGDVMACARVVQVFLATGSHLLSNADWGCKDGEHSAWLTVDADSKEEARHAIPSAFRDHAKIIALNKFTMEEIDSLMGAHKP